MGFVFSDRDHGLKGLVERVGSLSAASVRVGVLVDHAGDEKRKREKKGKKAKAESESADDGGASVKRTVLEIATIHEFGAPAAGIPARSFLRATVDEQQSAIRADQHKLAVDFLSGKIGISVALDRLGARVAAKIKERIARGIEPPLAARTVARKKSTKPLVDTGQLRSSITWEVET